MYIKKVRKSNRNSKKIYEYLHLVENVRTEKGPRQRLILNLGALDIPTDQYKELANCIESMLTGQKRLFSIDPTIEKRARKAVRGILAKRSKEQASDISNESTIQADYKEVDVASFEANEPRCIGTEYVCHSIWNELKINDVLLANGISQQLLPLFETLVVGRLVSPGSERHTWQWAENRSAIYELIERPLRASLSSLYRAGDTLFDCKDILETHLAKREKDLFSLPERMCFFDLTNTYFEGQAANNHKAKRGRSKEKRSDCKLLTLALIVDEQGFAKYSQLYPGNQAECKTLKQMIESLVRLRPELAKDRTVIIDAGIATAENIDYLKQNSFHYIVVHRGKSDFTPEDTNAMEIIQHTDKYKIEVKRYDKDNEAFLLCRSSGRQSKDNGIRTRQERLFIERLEYYRDGLNKKGRTKSYPKVIEMIGRLREKYPRASKLYEVETIPEDKPVKSVKAKDIVWKKRKLYDKQSKFDGCYVLRTDRCDLTDKEIWQTYVMLTGVEKAFRSMKSSLGLRPNFHQNEDRADAHMFISVLAYHIMHTIEYKLRQHGDHQSWETIRDLLSTHQRLTIEYNVKDQGRIQRHHLRLCSKAEPEHKLIYQYLGLSEVPLPRKFHAVK
jgi:transposase